MLTDPRRGSSSNNWKSSSRLSVERRSQPLPLPFFRARWLEYFTSAATLSKLRWTAADRATATLSCSCRHHSAGVAPGDVLQTSLHRVHQTWRPPETTQKRGQHTAVATLDWSCSVVVLVLTRLDHVRVSPGTCATAPNYGSHVPVDVANCGTNTSRNCTMGAKSAICSAVCRSARTPRPRGSAKLASRPPADVFLLSNNWNGRRLHLSPDVELSGVLLLPRPWRRSSARGDETDEAVALATSSRHQRRVRHGTLWQPLEIKKRGRHTGSQNLVCSCSVWWLFGCFVCWFGVALSLMGHRCTLFHHISEIFMNRHVAWV